MNPVDPQGSVAQRLNSSQAITSSSYYDEYGQEYTTGAPSDPFGYNAQSGYYVDRQDGIYFCGERYYDCRTGRCLTRDPIGQAGGINLYGYCASDPVMRDDASGLDVWIVTYSGGMGKGSHAAIAVGGWPDGGTYVYDFGPAEEPPLHMLYYLLGQCVHGEVLPGRFNPLVPALPSHPGEAPNDVVYVPTTLKQEHLVRAWLKRTESDDSNGWAGSYGFYNGVSHQCSTYVRDCLVSAGVMQLSGTNYGATNTTTPANLLSWALHRTGAKRVWHRRER
jgi:RHS repeat-associated protein